MLDLLREEIFNNFGRKNLPYGNGNYILHCSEAFMEKFKTALFSAGFVTIVAEDGKVRIPSIEEEFEMGIENLVTPELGKIQIIVDMEQGYKIEKV